MRLFISLLILTQINYAFAASLVNVRVGQFSEAASDSLPVIQRKIKNRLENESSQHLVFENQELHLSEKNYTLIRDDSRFNKLIQKVKKDNLNADEKKEWNKLLFSLEQQGDKKTAQEGYFAESYGLWVKGKKKESERLILKSLKLHPEGLGEYNADWWNSEVQDNKNLSFNVVTENMRAKLTLSCDIEVVNLPEDKKYLVDGFEIESKRNIHVQLGNIYRFSKGVGFETSLVSCKQQGKYRVLLSNQMVDDFDMVAFKRKANAFIFYKQDRNKIVVDSYSKKAGLLPKFLEIDLNKKNEIEISQNKLDTFSREHQLSRLDLAMGPNLRPNPQPQIPSIIEQESNAWYKNWVFWTITGVVAAGTLTYMLTKNNDNGKVGSNFSGIKISLE